MRERSIFSRLKFERVFILITAVLVLLICLISSKMNWNIAKLFSPKKVKQFISNRIIYKKGYDAVTSASIIAMNKQDYKERGVLDEDLYP
ncbi:MAG: hypothetical protein U9O41_05280 [Candidatus Aerophobetes bacterium]|nr:hypothetical protein [Candidatus Aerophobetes bacterium]